MDNLGGTARFYSLGADNSTGGSYQFNSLSANASAGSGTVMTILNSGNVGIGTTSPGYKLEVAGTARITSALTFGGNVNNIIAGTGSSLDFKSNGDYFFRKGTNTHLTILSGGNVGMGTTTPETKLHLLTTTTDETQQLLIQNGHSGDAAIKFNISGDTYSIGIDNSDGDKFKISAGNLGTNDRIVVDSTGNVGIGATTPSQKLEVAGQVLSAGYRLAAMQTAPAARNSTGTLGEIVIDGNHIYVCYATNSWSRVALETSW